MQAMHHLRCKQHNKYEGRTKESSSHTCDIVLFCMCCVCMMLAIQFFRECLCTGGQFCPAIFAKSLNMHIVL